MWFSQSGNYINKPAIIEIYTCNHVGIWLQFIDKKQRGVVCLVAAIYAVIGPSVDISKLFDRPANPGQFLVVNRFLPAEIPNALMSTDRPTTDKKKNCLSMVGRWSTVGRRTLQRLLQLKKSTTVAEKNYYLARRTQNRSADEKKRSNSAKTMADELPTVAQRIPFLLKTRLPLVVFFLNMTSLRFK